MDDVVFVGNWVKERTLGSGSFGVVVLWRHRHTAERLAIKSCRWGDELTARQRERWAKEVEMLRNCDNENIVGTRKLPPEFVTGLECANPSRLPFLCMEYCTGGNLRQQLHRVDACSGLKEIQVRTILSHMKNALEFLHKNKITHRDLKPENIVIQIYENEDLKQAKVTYKLIDLGYAKEIDSKSVAASFVGTLQYLAPELFYSKTYSNSVDFWSFGLLAFEIVCGVRPFLPLLAPVQWMPLVKKKSSEHICVYETYHGDVEYSSEIFPENHITAPFKKLLEKWLKTALEYDPKLRGKDGSKGVTFALPTEINNDQDCTHGNTQASEIIFFSLLQDVLSRKIIRVFSAYTLEILAYVIDELTSISTIKSWIEQDTKTEKNNQILLSQKTYKRVEEYELAIDHWDDKCGPALFLYHKEEFMLSIIQPKVPKAIQRCLEQPKTVYNFRNSRNLYRSAMYFLQSEKELYDLLITSCFIKAESLKVECNALFLKHNEVEKILCKLRTMQEILSMSLDTSRKRVCEIRAKLPSGVFFLSPFEDIFTKAEEGLQNVGLLEAAWRTLTTRLNSATRRSNETVRSELLNNFFSKYNYLTLLSEMSKVYITYKLNEKDFRSSEKQCKEVVKIICNCLKVRDKIVQEIRSQAYVVKILDICLELHKIRSTIETASENAEKLNIEMSKMFDDLVKTSWSAITQLATAAGDNLELPYSVISFDRNNFKVGEAVTNHKIAKQNSFKTEAPKSLQNSNSSNDLELKTLIVESMRIRELQNKLVEKINLHQQEINSDDYDFSFLDE